MATRFNKGYFIHQFVWQQKYVQIQVLPETLEASQLCLTGISSSSSAKGDVGTIHCTSLSHVSPKRVRRWKDWETPMGRRWQRQEWGLVNQYHTGFSWHCSQWQSQPAGKAEENASAHTWNTYLLCFSTFFPPESSSWWSNGNKLHNPADLQPCVSLYQCTRVPDINPEIQELLCLAV